MNKLFEEAFHLLCLFIEQEDLTLCIGSRLGTDFII